MIKKYRENLVNRCLSIGSWLLISCLLVIPVSAQTTSEESRPLLPMPESGAWTTMEGNNTGLYFEVQDGVLAGAYFGFDDNGNPTWLTFNGELASTTLLDIHEANSWQVTAPLQQLQNGGCILNCTDVNNQATVVNELGFITIVFNARSSGGFFITDEDPSTINLTDINFTSIVPFYFGTPGIKANVAGNTSVSSFVPGLFLVPDLAGTWVTAISSGSGDVNGLGNLNSALSRPDVLFDGSLQLNETAGIMEVGETVTIVPTPEEAIAGDFTILMITQNLILSESSGELIEFINRGPGPTVSNLDGVMIECFYATDTPERPSDSTYVLCVVTGGGFNFGCAPCTSIHSNVPASMMTDNRFNFYARSVSETSSVGITRFEAFRLDYD